MNFIALGLACLAMGVVGIGEGIAVMKALEGMGRNPAASKDIRSSMIVGVALIETVAIYILVIALIIAFAMK